MKHTPLHDAHILAGAKTGAFAGYDMPLYYPEGVIAEHEWTRTHAGLFDVSHMGQISISGAGSARFLERMTPSTIGALAIGQAKYTVLTNERGGIVDDLIVTRSGGDAYFCVINAGTKDKDIAWLTEHLPNDVTLENLDDRSLIALQGSEAEQALREALAIDMAELRYMRLQVAKQPCGTEIFVSRLGYTGEDGFELSVPDAKAVDVWQTLAAHPSVKPVGLAARDSLRLEMGYPLYGHDIDDATTPVEAGIGWVIGRKNTGFIGADEVLKHLHGSAERVRVGIKLTGQGVAREGAEIRTTDGALLGTLTSGGFSPTLKQSIGMGYVPSGTVQPGDAIVIEVRHRAIPAIVTAMPFVPARTRSAKVRPAQADSLEPHVTLL